MPTNILRFERFAYLSLFLGVLANVFDKATRVEIGALKFGILTAVIAVIAAALIYLAARRRQNWARWVFTVITALSVAATGYLTYAEPTAQPLYLGLAIVSTLVDVIAVYFIFTGDSGPWFKNGSSSNGGLLNASAR